MSTLVQIHSASGLKRFARGREIKTLWADTVPSNVKYVERLCGSAVSVKTKLWGVFALYRIYLYIWVVCLLRLREARDTQWWEHSPPTKVDRVQILASWPRHRWVELLLLLSSILYSKRFFSCLGSKSIPVRPGMVNEKPLCEVFLWSVFFLCICHSLSFLFWLLLFFFFLLD